MKATDELSIILTAHFAWHKSRIDCLIMILFALIKKQTVNLTRIANAMGGKAEIDSRYRRLQRFFSEVRFDYDIIAKLIFNLFVFSKKEFYLSIDRTNWQWGERNINILMLGIVYKGTSIPILWLLLNKKGNSNTRERIALMKRFIHLFGKDRIKGLLADREFIGIQWLKWLHKEEIPYCIRLKKSALTTDIRGNKVNVKQLFHHLRAGESLHLGKRKLLGNLVYLSGLRLETGELLILAHLKLDVNELNAIEIYALRWEIETLFSCLKGRGFNFEETRILKRTRIKKMVAVLAIAFCWSHKIGEWRNDCVKKIHIKTHGRLAQSLFRYGLDWLDDLLSGEGFRRKRKLLAAVRRVFSPPMEQQVC